MDTDTLGSTKVAKVAYNVNKMTQQTTQSLHCAVEKKGGFVVTNLRTHFCSEPITSPKQVLRQHEHQMQQQ